MLPPADLRTQTAVSGTRGISSFPENNRPTWAEISLATLTSNFKNIQRFVGKEVAVCAVVKADAYRHGVVECATALEKAGARWFGVTSTEEGVQLRQAGVQGRILVMTGFWHGDEDAIIEQNLTPAVWEDWHLQYLHRAVQRRGGAVRVHLKIDTGMARLGVLRVDLQHVSDYLKTQSELQLEGIFTHMASAEMLDETGTAAQLVNFCQAATLIRQNGHHPKFIHAANSAAIASRRDAWHNMVRPGISLYGYYPTFAPQQPEVPQVSQVLSWKTRIISIRKSPKGQPVGYNGTFTTARDSRIAVLPVGYADGLNRQLSSKGRVLIRNQYAPIVGRVSMDLTLVDVTDIEGAQIADEVILLGTSGERQISASEHAALASTISYEVLCNISKRVPRHYMDDLAH
jgi:alanine racemase